MTTIDITKYILDKRFWREAPLRMEYSGHMYRGSAIETSSDCGNCDGARCDGCELVNRNEPFEMIPFGVDADLYKAYYDACIKAGASTSAAHAFVFNGQYSCEGYSLYIPTFSDLLCEYPEFAQTLIKSEEEKYVAELKDSSKVVLNAKLQKDTSLDWLWKSDYSVIIYFGHENHRVMGTITDDGELVLSTFFETKNGPVYYSKSEHFPDNLNYLVEKTVDIVDCPESVVPTVHVLASYVPAIREIITAKMSI